jgi:hypothetical protein
MARRLRRREVRKDLLLEALPDVGKAHGRERADASAAAERQHQVIEPADPRELGGKRVRRGGVRLHDLRFRAELPTRLDEASFVAPGDGDREPDARRWRAVARPIPDEPATMTVC